MHGIPIEHPSPSHCRDDAEDADSEIFSVRFANAFHFLGAEERTSHHPIGALVKISQRSLSAKNQSNGTDHRDTCLEEELDCRLERMTEIAQTLRAACARQREQFLAFRANARWCYRDCMRLFADMTRHYCVRLSAQRREVAKSAAAMAVVTNRNLELNKVFGELLARATCTIDDLEERNERTRRELCNQREENGVLERRIASLENASRSAQQSTSFLLAELRESEARVKETEGKVESFDKVAKYYEQLLEASHRKLCLYEEYGESSRRTLSDKSQYVCHTCKTDNSGHGSVAREGTKIKTQIRGFNCKVHARASSDSVVCERTVECGSCKLASTTNSGYTTRAHIDSKNKDDITDGCVAFRTNEPMPVEDTTSQTSLLAVGTRRRRGSNACNTADTDANSASLLSEPPVRLPRKRTQKKRRLTRQLRKSCSFKDVDQPEEVASEQPGGVRRERRKSSTVPYLHSDDDQQQSESSSRRTLRERSKSSVVPYLHQDDGQQSEASSKRTQRERLNDGEPLKIVTFMPGQPEDIYPDDVTTHSQTDDSTTLMSKDPTSQNKAKRTPTFKGLKISGNVGFASFVRDVHRKLRRPRRSKTVELADLIGVRKVDTDSLNSDCNL